MSADLRTSGDTWRLLERQKHPEYVTPFTDVKWELKLFAECSAQDPWFKEVALGPDGLQKKIIYALDQVLSEGMPDRDVEWENLSHIIEVLAKWTWDVRIVGSL